MLLPNITARFWQKHQFVNSEPRVTVLPWE